MGFLSKMFNKVKSVKKTAEYCGEDKGCYISSDSNYGIFLQGNSEEVREEIREKLVERLEKIGKEDIKGKIRKILEDINEDLHIRGLELSGVIYYKEEKHLEILHIGLSRVYIVRENEIMQLTEDDTQGWNLFKTGVFTEERLKSSPLGKMLTKSLGKSRNVQINTSEYYFTSGEKLLIISGEDALKYGDDKLYDIFAGSLDLAIEKFEGNNYLLRTFS